jgi:O-antigen/teichoic acid export membrane protein
MSAEAATSVPTDEPSLRAKMTRGFLWKLASQIVDQGGRTLMAVILARMLTPSEYGLAGMAFVFTGIALIFTDRSLGSALVQRVAITERDRSTVFWTTTAGGIAIAVASYAVAPAIGNFFSEPEVTSLFRVVAFTFVLTALSATQVALLTRDLSFRALELREMAGGLARIATAITMAVMGFGAWSIVGGSVAAAAVSLVMLWTASSWRPSFIFSIASLCDLGSYGIKALGSRLFIYVTENADNLLVGKYLGSAALGIYSLAYNAMLSPLARIVGPVAQVLFPALSRIQTDTDRVVSTWLRTTAATAAIMFPAFTGIAIVAPDLVSVVFGDKWNAAVPVLQLLCIGGLATTLQALNLSVLQARNRPGTYLRFNILNTAASIAGFAVGLHWGVVGVAASVGVVRAGLLPLNAWLSCRVVAVSLATYFGTFRKIAETTLLMAAGVLAVRSALDGPGFSPALRLVLEMATGAFIYGAILIVRERALIAEVRRLRSA